MPAVIRIILTAGIYGITAAGAMIIRIMAMIIRIMAMMAEAE
jgi:hypothetical protein